MSILVFVDCEGHGPAPGLNDSTKFEFGAVCRAGKNSCTLQARTEKVFSESSAVTDYKNGIDTFHGKGGGEAVFCAFAAWLQQLGWRDTLNPRSNKDRAVFMSDNPAYDWPVHQLLLHLHCHMNPFGHSARRISDFYAGLRGDFTQTQAWKKWRRTPHDHNPVNDAMGNLEAFEEILRRHKAGTITKG